jgi:predicted kinase
MQEVIMLRGLPASGKSTWARQQVINNPGKYKRVNKDELRETLDVSVWTKANETFVEKTRDFIISQALEQGKSVIIDDTNINPKHEKRVKELVLEYSASSGNDVNFFVKEFIVDLAELLKRDRNRENPVGASVIKRMHSQWTGHLGDYPGNEYVQHLGPEYPWLTVWERDNKLQGAYIFDVDGTLSLLNGRNPYDGTNAVEDLENYPVTRVLTRLSEMTDKPFLNNKIIIFTGRDGKYRKETEDWLDLHNIHYDEFYIRAEGDDRKDSVIKKEMYETHVKGRYQILGVFDDRPQVRRMWIDEGLFVFSCYQNRNFMEF